MLVAAATCWPLAAAAVATGPANAAMSAAATPVGSAPSGHWGNAHEISLAPLGGTGPAVEAMSCDSPGNCMAGGTFTDQSGSDQVFVVAEVNGTWQQAEKIPGLDSKNGEGFVTGMTSMSCAEAGDCAAAGTYGGPDGEQRAFIVESNNGTWQPPVQLTFGQYQVQPGEGFSATVDCPEAGDCAAGLIVPVQGIDSFGPVDEAFVADEVNGVWGAAQPVPDSFALNDDLNAGTNTVSCFAPGDCVAGGWYSHAGVIQHAFVATETGGTWGAAMPVPGLSQLVDFGTDSHAQVTSAACSTANECTVSGYYLRTDDHLQDFLATETDGTWSTSAIEVAGDVSGSMTGAPSGLACDASGGCTVAGTLASGGSDTWRAFVSSGPSGPEEVPGLNDSRQSRGGPVACTASRCITAGNFVDSQGHRRAFAADERAGIWADAETIGGTLLADASVVSIRAASCGAPGYCAIGGSVLDSTGELNALVVDESPATITGLSLSKAKVTFGGEQAERLAITVRPRTGGIPSGKAVIKAGSTTLCTVTLAKGKGTCKLKARKLRPGHYKLTGTFGGNATYSRSASAKKTLTVAK
jgi:hypothetical protein